VRDNRPAQRLTQVETLKPGGPGLVLSPALFQDLQPDSAALLVSASGAGRLDLPGLLLSLDRYPYGCAEQVASRALPLLYVDQIALAAGLSGDLAGGLAGGVGGMGGSGGPIGQMGGTGGQISQTGGMGGARGGSQGRGPAETGSRIQAAITDLVGKQGSDGGFGLWGPGGDDFWLDAYVTDFLSRARAQGYTVPDTAFRNALDNLIVNQIITTLLVQIGEVVALPLQLAIYTLLYFDLRIRKEGYDLELIAQQAASA